MLAKTWTHRTLGPCWWEWRKTQALRKTLRQLPKQQACAYPLQQLAQPQVFSQENRVVVTTRVWGVGVIDEVWVGVKAVVMEGH